MNDSNGYAVFFFPQALEALGEAIKPYLQDGPAGPHVVCNEIDTAGALIEMTLQGTTREGRWIALELMVPSNMVRMIVSTQSDESFGFGPRLAAPAPVPELPPVGPTAEPATAASGTVPDSTQVPDAGEAAPAPGNEAAKPAP